MTEFPDDLILRPRHLHAASLCARGGRFAATAAGVDWNEVVKNGLRWGDLKQYSDNPLLIRVAEAAMRERTHGQGK